MEAFDSGGRHGCREAPLFRVHLALQQLYMEKRGIVLQSFGHNRLMLVRERITPDNETLQAATIKLTSGQRNCKPFGVNDLDLIQTLFCPEGIGSENS